MDKKNKDNKKKILLIKTILILIIFTISFLYTVKFLDNVNLKVDDLFLKSLIPSSNKFQKPSISSELVEYIAKLDLFDPVNILKNNYKGLVTDAPKKENIIDNSIPAIKDEPSNVLDNKENDPLIYIYNSHQDEEYASNNLKDYNVKPTVLLASYILQEKLQKYNINSIVENSNISELLRINNWNYAYSYNVTKMLMEQAKKDYPSLIYFVDLHRDSVSKDKTTAIINNKNYAKVLFLLGLENKTYQENKKVINRLNTIISTKYQGISKGIYEKGGPLVNGVYNQDFSNNCVLIEVGGIDNTIEEVSNTIDAIAYMLSTYIGEDNG